MCGGDWRRYVPAAWRVWLDASPAPRPQSRSLGFVGVDEDHPGARWQDLYAETRDAYQRWWLEKGADERPTRAAAEAALARHMPELVTTHQRLVELADDDDTAAAMLALSYNVTLCDRSGRVAAVFLAPDRPARVTDRRATTNHPETVEWPEHAAWVHSVERLETLRTLAASDADAVTAALLAPPLIARQWDAGFATLFTAAYRPSAADSITTGRATTSHSPSIRTFPTHSTLPSNRCSNSNRGARFRSPSAGYSHGALTFALRLAFWLVRRHPHVAMRWSRRTLVLASVVVTDPRVRRQLRAARDAVYKRGKS